MTEEKIHFALQKAFDRFDEWVECTGVLVKHTTYYNECQSCIEDAVKIGIMSALGIPVEYDNCGQLIDKRLWGGE